MADNDALLAYLVSSFPGNTENIATETLGHILARSDASIEALNDVVQSGVRDVKPIAGVQTQVLHPDGTCPDMVGFDEDKMERVLIEVKFWAELTDNQPNRYLDRLPGEGPAVLMFLTPDDRIMSLWPELRRRVEAEGKRLYDVESERRCMRVGDTERHLMMVSWTGLLDSMAARSRDADERPGWGRISANCGTLPSMRTQERSSQYATERNSAQTRSVACGNISVLSMLPSSGVSPRVGQAEKA